MKIVRTSIMIVVGSLLGSACQSNRMQMSGESPYWVDYIVSASRAADVALDVGAAHSPVDKDKACNIWLINTGEKEAAAAPSGGVAPGLARAAGESAGGIERGPQGSAQHPDQRPMADLLCLA